MNGTRSWQKAVAAGLAVFAHLGIACLLFTSTSSLPTLPPLPIVVRLQPLKPAVPAAATTAEPAAAIVPPPPAAAPETAPSEPEPTPEPKPELSLKPEPKPKPESRPTVQPEQRPRLAKSPTKAQATVAKAPPAAAVDAASSAAASRPGTQQSAMTVGQDADSSVRPMPDNPKPHYPPFARRLGYEGRVVVRILVLPTGTVGTASIERSSGYAVLDEAALAAIKRWRFRPAQRAGQPVDATLNVPITFKLHEPG